MSELVVDAGQVKRLAVIGAGTMGRGIAQVAAMSGIDAVLCDRDADVVAAALRSIGDTLGKGVALGKTAPEARDAALGRLSRETALARAVAEVDAVIEAVPEDLALKQGLFGEIERWAPKAALLATNTSSLPIAAIAGALRDGRRLCGMHFFNPVHLMKLVELVRHPTCDAAVIACARGLSDRLGKTAIEVRDAPGFASSRLGIAIGLEAMRMVEEEVASPADIDTAMKLGYGFPMGPLELTDLVGLDVRLAIADHLAATLGERFAAPAGLRARVAAGKLGRKSGEGYYRWVDGKRDG